MFSTVGSPSSSSPLTAIGVALVAITVAGCSPDVTRFDNNSFSSAARTDQRNGGLSSRSVAGPTFGPGATLIARPEADLANGKSAEVASRSNSAVRVAALEDRPRKSRRDGKPNLFAKRNARVVPKGANLRHGIVSVNTQRPHKQSPQKAPRMRSAETRAMDTAPIFNWPVHGKILARFGPRPNGENNDGINIAVPEDSPIRPAQDGVVIYAGSALKESRGAAPRQ
jgi:murein DD-endopeptidase MepM/ murein hydrolase activator NlpD